MIFNGFECQILNFKDITVEKQLKSEKEKGRLLNKLCSSIHHEMIDPLKANIKFVEYLIQYLNNDVSLKETAQLIVISSKTVLFHAHDILDH